MTFDWVLGFFVGLSTGILLGVTVGVAQFRKGVETGIRMHMFNEFVAQQREQSKADPEGSARTSPPRGQEGP